MPASQTIIGSIKILAEGIRKARARKPTLITLPTGLEHFGYEIELNQVPVATENVFHNYDETSAAIIRFRLSDNSYLQIFFPKQGECFVSFPEVRPFKS